MAEPRPDTRPTPEAPKAPRALYGSMHQRYLGRFAMLYSTPDPHDKKRRIPFPVDSNTQDLGVIYPEASLEESLKASYEKKGMEHLGIFRRYDMIVNVRRRKSYYDQGRFSRPILNEEITKNVDVLRRILGTQAEAYLCTSWEDRTILLSDNLPVQERVAAAGRLGIRKIEDLRQIKNPNGSDVISMGYLKSKGIEQVSDLSKLNNEDLETVVMLWTSTKVEQLKNKVKTRKDKAPVRTETRDAPSPARTPEPEEAQPARTAGPAQENPTQRAAATEEQTPPPAKTPKKEKNRSKAARTETPVDPRLVELVKDIPVIEDQVYKTYADPHRQQMGYYDNANARVFDRLVRGALRQGAIRIDDNGRDITQSPAKMSNGMYLELYRMAMGWAKAEGIIRVAEQTQFFTREIDNAVDRIFEGYRLALGRGENPNINSFLGRDIPKLREAAIQQNEAEAAAAEKNKKKKEKNVSNQDSKTAQEATPQQTPPQAEAAPAKVTVFSNFDNDADLDLYLSQQGGIRVDQEYYDNLKSQLFPNVRTFDRVVRAGLVRGWLRFDDMGQVIATDSNFWTSREGQVARRIVEEWSEDQNLSQVELLRLIDSTATQSGKRLMNVYAWDTGRGKAGKLEDYLGSDLAERVKRSRRT